MSQNEGVHMEVDAAADAPVVREVLSERQLHTIGVLIPFIGFAGFCLTFS